MKKLTFQGMTLFTMILSVLLLGGIAWAHGDYGAQSQSQSSLQDQSSNQAQGATQQYLITLMHKAQSCKVAFNSFQKDVASAGIAGMDNAGWACSDRNRVSYLIVTAKSEDDARAMIPKSWQRGMTVSALSPMQAPGASDQTGQGSDQPNPATSGPMSNPGSGVNPNPGDNGYPPSDTTGVGGPTGSGVNPNPGDNQMTPPDTSYIPGPNDQPRDNRYPYPDTTGVPRPYYPYPDTTGTTPGPRTYPTTPDSTMSYPQPSGTY